MNKYLLEYKDALKIVEKYNNSRSSSNFWETQYIIDGFKLSTFNYFICGWNDFNNPLNDDSGITAFDMRGTTFVFEDGEIVDRFFMLPKFFNINQVESTQYDILKDKKIANISSKEDGSLIAFMNLPNGKLFAKTIGSFVSDQAIAAYRVLYSNEEHVVWVKNVLSWGYTPLFEYVSWDNRIVLKYSSAHLRLIGFRDNYTGEYIPARDTEPCDLFGTKSELLFIPEGIVVAAHEKYSLDELMEKAKSEEEKEGWVIQFRDGQLVKVKTEWYFKMHGLRTENVFREDYVIKNYLEETLDDIITQLDREDDSDAFDFIGKVTSAIDNYMDHIDGCTSKLKKVYEDAESNWHYFAKFNNKEPYFGLVKSRIESSGEYRRRKIELILKRTYRLKNAKQIVERWETKITES